jgi:hypothetical protein
LRPALAPRANYQGAIRFVKYLSPEFALFFNFFFKRIHAGLGGIFLGFPRGGFAAAEGRLIPDWGKFISTGDGFAANLPAYKSYLIQGDLYVNRKRLASHYGHESEIDRIAISVFENPEEYAESSDAKTYCDTINSLELRENAWVFARTVSCNAPYTLNCFLPIRFGVLLRLDDKAIQKTLREIDAADLAKALRGAAEPIQEKVFRNMSTRAVALLKEDMEYMGMVRLQDVEAAREKIVTIIRRLNNYGEISIYPCEKGDQLL